MSADKEAFLANAIAEATALMISPDNRASYFSQDPSSSPDSSSEEKNQESIFLELTLPEALGPGTMQSFETYEN